MGISRATPTGLAGTLPATKLGDGTSAYIIAREDVDAAKAAA